MKYRIIIIGLVFITSLQSCAWYQGLVSSKENGGDATNDQAASNKEQLSNDQMNITEDDNLRVVEPPTKKVVIQCANKKVTFAKDLQARSKRYLKNYYRYRNTSSLYFSWYALEDSNFVLDSIKNCDDKSNKHFYAVQNMSRQNTTPADLISKNTRSKDYLSFTELYLDEYYQIFPRDLN